MARMVSILKQANSKHNQILMVQIKNGAPEAHITVNRNRLKSYQNSFYMKDKTNFEIEIFNPLTERVLAVIEIDGKLISSTGIVVNPGQRVYLERWIDDSKKFKFSTYDVENTEESKSAIAKNGKVKVSFHHESNKYLFPTWGNTGIIYTGTPSTQPYYYNTHNSNYCTLAGTTVKVLTVVPARVQ